MALNQSKRNVFQSRAEKAPEVGFQFRSDAIQNRLLQGFEFRL